MAGLDPAIPYSVAANSQLRKELEMQRGGWYYMVTNRRDGVLNLGVTSDTARRAWEHREDVIDGFTRKYRLKRLVWAELHDDIYSAIQRENIKH